MSNYYSILFRMKYINRWSLMRNMEKENLAEHSLDVAFITHALALIKNALYGGDVNCEKAAVCAMFHDTCEVFTGDMPTPVKYYNVEIKTAYKQIERAADKKLIDSLPDFLREDFKSIYEPEKEIKQLIKAADKIAALIKCTKELKLDNNEFSKAKESTLESMKKLNMPEAEYFIEEFLPAFELPLDTLL